MGRKGVEVSSRRLPTIPRKPVPIGMEGKCSCDGESNIMLRSEVQQRKVAMNLMPYQSEDPEEAIPGFWEAFGCSLHNPDKMQSILETSSSSDNRCKLAITDNNAL